MDHYQAQQYGELARLLLQLWRVREAGEVCMLAIAAYDRYPSELWKPGPYGPYHFHYMDLRPKEPWWKIARTRWAPHNYARELGRVELEEMQQKIARAKSSMSYLMELQQELEQELRLLDPVNSWKHPGRRPHLWDLC